MRRPLVASTGAITVAPLLLVDLRTDGGIIGRAYLWTPGAHHLAPLAKLVEVMGGLLKGDAVAPFEIEKKLRARYTLLGVHNIVLFAMSAIDMCAWDALGQALGQPVVRLLGGEPRPVMAYNSKGLGIQGLKSLAKEAEELVAEGFFAVKLRLGRPEAKDDLEALRVVKKVIGLKVTLMVDFNQALTVAEAIRASTRNGAYASFEENVKGTLEPGKFADLVVLGRDPFREDPSTLRTIPVERTMTGGRWVFES